MYSLPRYLLPASALSRLLSWLHRLRRLLCFLRLRRLCFDISRAATMAMFPDLVCQICGVAFDVRRTRSPNELSNNRYLFRTVIETWDEVYYTCGSKSGCKLVFIEDVNGQKVIRAEYPIRGPEPPAADRNQHAEHVAGPSCICREGYSGYRITAEEMMWSNRMQCMVKKRIGWRPEDDDHDYERRTDYFLTGIGMESMILPPNIQNLRPRRHGVRQVQAYNNLPGVGAGQLLHRIRYY